MTDDRKAKLKALAARAGRAKEPRIDENGKEEGNEAVIVAAPKKVVFRNYAPNDKSIQQQDQSNNKELELSSPSSKRQKQAASTSTTTQAGESSQVAVAVSSSKALQDALQETRREVNAVDTTASAAVVGKTSNTVAAISTVTSMAPKKINWDLKRDISDKLAKLERRTQKAVVNMLKERLESEAAKAVNEDDCNDDDSDLD